MKNVILIDKVSSEKIKIGEYKEVLPELSALENVYENNAWHKNQSVLDHTVKVYESLETILNTNILFKNCNSQISAYLSENIGNITRKNILKIAAILHDIGKKDTLVETSPHFTSCPGHEQVGANMVKDFELRFALERKAADYVRRIVEFHGIILNFVNLIEMNNSRDMYFKIFQDVVGDIEIELIILKYADILGSDLTDNIKNNIQQKKVILSWMLLKNKKA